jgi:hypothetical protein
VYAGTPAASSATDGSCGGRGRVLDSLLNLGIIALARRSFWAGSVEGLENENGITPALLAISCSPSCQCIASAARQGIAISSAIFAHISDLNLHTGQQALLSVHYYCFFFISLDCTTHLSYSLASLFFLSSSQSLRLSR